MSSEIEKLLGSRIAEIRKRQGLTQFELASLIGVAFETISRLERGVSIPSLKTVETISNVLNVSLRELFDFKYTVKSMDSEMEKETRKLLAFLKSRTANEIKVGYRVLKGLFEEIEKVYRPKKA
jgi:transcriptional regulator with XRE-family HTH domain